MSGPRFGSSKEMRAWQQRIGIEQKASRLNLLRQDLEDLEDPGYAHSKLKVANSDIALLKVT